MGNFFSFATKYYMYLLTDLSNQTFWNTKIFFYAYRSTYKKIFSRYKDSPNHPQLNKIREFNTKS